MDELIKAIKNTNFLPLYSILFPSVISVISIFISNKLGRAETLEKHQLSNQESTYTNYHIPLITWLYGINDNYLTYYWCVAINRATLDTPDFLLNHIQENIALAPTNVAKNFNKYLVSSKSSQLFYEDYKKNEQYENSAKEASLKFDIIIEESLKESIILAKKLGYPDISTPLLTSFYACQKNDKISDRHK